MGTRDRQATVKDFLGKKGNGHKNIYKGGKEKGTLYSHSTPWHFDTKDTIKKIFLADNS